MLYLPHSYALDNDTVAALRRYVAAGGTLWADGLTAWKDDYGNVRPEMPGGLVDVFGVKVDDIQVMPGEFPLTRRDSRGGEAIRLRLALHGAEVVEQGGDGFPAATRHRHGKGTAILFGTALTWGYHKHPDAAGGRLDCRAGPADRRARWPSRPRRRPRGFSSAA